MAAELISTLMKPLATTVGAKLGRCFSCMRLAAGLAIGFWLLLALMEMAGADPALIFAAAVPAAALTMWSVAHGVAYVARGPKRAKGCRSCAEKAKARQRAALWRRRLSRLRLTKAAPPQRSRKGGCRNCGSEKNALKSADTAAALPPAEEGLRHVAEQSPEFQALLPRLASAEPVDTWKANMQSFFLYELKPDEDGLIPHAVFITRWEDDVPISAVVITPDPAGGEPKTVNLRALAVGGGAASEPS